MSKVIFGNGDEAGESVLRQWETMHRPPDTIAKSGPYAPRLSSTGQSGRAGLIVPPPTYSRSGSGSRRHSVISSPKDNIGQFPLRTSTSKESRVSNEARRISEVFLGGKKTRKFTYEFIGSTFHDNYFVSYNYSLLEARECSIIP